MPVLSAQSSISYTGDGATITFPVPFYFLLGTDLVVTVAGAQQSFSGDYIVTGAHVAAGGAVTFGVAPLTGATVVIARNPPQTQLLNVVNNETALAQTLDDALDKMVMLVQALQTQISANTANEAIDAANIVSLQNSITVMQATLNTLTSLAATGVINFALLPTTLPAVSGTLWNNGGVLCIA